MRGWVFATHGGRRFHEYPDCEALELGRQASGGWYGVRTLAPVDAARRGFTACRVCVPPHLALPATGETYGHEPVADTGWYGEGETVCVRCTERGLYWSTYGEHPRPVHVIWPCTSAVVLGLVPRGGA